MKTNLIKKITASIVLAHMFSFSFFWNTFAAVSPVTITFTDNVAVWPVQSDTLNISVSGTSGSPTYLYAFSSTNSVCNGWDFNGTTYSFTPWSSFTITNS